MRLLTSGLLVSLAVQLCEAGVLGVRQAQAQSCATVSRWGYITITATAPTTVTVTATPPTITILQQDPNSILSSKGQIDTIQVSQQVVEAPVSAPWTAVETFVDSAIVSGYEATEISNIPGGSVYYLSKTSSGAHSDIVAGVITRTVIPVPLSTLSTKQQQDVNTTSSSSTGSSAPNAFTSPHGSWNSSTSTGSSLFGPATAANGSRPAGTGYYGSPAPFTPATDVQPTSAQHGRTSTVTEIATVYTTLPTDSTYGYGTSAYINGSGASVSGDLEKRQTCVWISATIGGREVGWCNNYGGPGSVLTFTSWETTIYPSYIPGIGSITHTSTSTPSAPENPTNSPPSAQTTSRCGGTGPFQIGFDDLIENTSDEDFTMAPPIQDPYDHFDWSNGWGYVPPPNDPFPPQSGDRLAVWDPSLNNTVMGSKNAGSLPPGGIGCLKNDSNHYWFNADSAYVGCDNQDPSQVCDFVATAYQWDDNTQSSVVVATQHFHIPACPDFVQCELTKVDFNYLFYKMSIMQFYAVVAGQFSKFWVDSINMNWFNNTCEAGLARISGQE